MSGKVQATRRTGKGKSKISNKKMLEHVHRTALTFTHAVRDVQALLWITRKECMNLNQGGPVAWEEVQAITTARDRMEDSLLELYHEAGRMLSMHKAITARQRRRFSGRGA